VTVVRFEAIIKAELNNEETLSIDEASEVGLILMHSNK